MNKSSVLADWTPEQIALGKRWVETWRLAGEDLERIRRKEIRELDTYKTILFSAGPRITPNLHTRQNPGLVSSNNNGGSKRQQDVNEVIQAAAELRIDYVE